jgi:hypothetical protein
VVTRRGPSEPQAYETAFAVRGLLERYQKRPDGEAPFWVTWGPYLWADAIPRSDGLVWTCEDLEPDLIHPSESGAVKVAQQLLAFFMAHPTAAPWFLDQAKGRSRTSGPLLTASRTEGRAPLVVDFGTSAEWPTGSYWSFPDGTFSLSARPRKTFYREGVYEVWLTTTDASGQWARSSIQVQVQP